MSTLRERRGFDVNLRSGPQMREYIALADRVAADRPGRVLDWGCGWGQVTILLRERGLDVESFDYRPDVDGVEVVPLERYPEQPVTLSSEPVALPYETGEFDAVLSCGVLEHVQDPGASLDELRRVLKPGGRLYVIKLPNRTSYLEWIARRMGLYYHGELEHDTIYTPAWTRELIASHGFRVEDVRLANMLPLTIDHPLVRRFSGAIWWLNKALARIPGLRRLATNVEADASALSA
jgi:2-polyprenyl-3-methyl-5-hydroxy-6-metoxy-1,4-benzoquinol methylase